MTAALPDHIRTFLDDLFVPRLDFFHWDRLRLLLERHGFGRIECWGAEARLDHEHSLAAYREDLESLVTLLAAGCAPAFGEAAPLFAAAHDLARSAVDAIRWFEMEVAAGRIAADSAMDKVIGQGHHRLFATRMS